MTSWEFSPFTTALKRRRVVWATGLAIATFWPIQAFKSVDLPTLGRPTKATKPLLKGVVSDEVFLETELAVICPPTYQ